MMNKLTKPAGLLLYLLTFVVFFFVGSSYVGISGIAKDQGLAGGAMVLFYGLVFAGLAFIASLFLCYYAPHKTIVIVNKILAIVFIIFTAVFIYKLR